MFGFTNVNNLINHFQAQYFERVEEKTPASHCIVPRSSDSVSDKYKSKERQEEYIEKSWAICEQLLNAFKEEYLPSLDDVFTLVGTGRSLIAKSFKSIDSELFGVLRTENYSDRISTDLEDEYQSMVDALIAIPEKSDDSSSFESMEWEFFMEGQEEAPRFGFRLGKMYTGEAIRLSKYSFTPSTRKGTIGHTYPENLKKAKEQCEFLYKEIMRIKTDGDDAAIAKVWALIGELHWWMAQGTFWFRGSAACTEIIIGALIIHKFGNILPYKKGVYADRIALVSSCEEFVRDYRSLREDA